MRLNSTFEGIFQRTHKTKQLQWIWFYHFLTLNCTPGFWCHYCNIFLWQYLNFMVVYSLFREKSFLELKSGTKTFRLEVNTFFHCIIKGKTSQLFSKLKQSNKKALPKFFKVWMNLRELPERWQWVPAI